MPMEMAQTMYYSLVASEAAGSCHSKIASSSLTKHPELWYSIVLLLEPVPGDGESCGSCFCPPTYTFGVCGPGLKCVKNPLLPDAAGKCRPIGDSDYDQYDRFNNFD